MVKWSDIKPSFLKGKGSDNRGSRRQNRSSASRDLSAAEYFSNNKDPQQADPNSSTESLAEAESSADSLYSGSGRQKSKGKSRLKGFFKKGGAPLAIGISLFGGVAVFFGSTSLLGPHLSSVLTEATDSQYTSINLRTNKLLSYMIDGGDQLHTSWTGKKKYTTFSPFLKSRLKKNGIEVGHLNADGEFESGDLIAGKKRVIKFNDEIISADDFSVRYATDVEFREAYYKAKRGRVGCFFDKVADAFYKKIGISRNVFEDWETTGDAETDEENYHKKVADQYGEGDTDIGIRNKDDEDTDEDGKPKTDDSEASTKDTGGDVGPDDPDTPKTPAEVEAETNLKAQKYIDGLSKVSQVTNAGCALVKIGAAISVAVAANEIYQSITYYQTNMENVSKMMAGKGVASAVNEFLNFLTTPATTETTDFSSAKASASAVTSDQVNGDKAEIKADTVKDENKSPIEAEGMKLLLGNSGINQKSVANYSLERIKFAFTTTVGAFAACSGFQAAGAVVSIISTIGTFGISTIIGAAFSAAVSIGVAIGVAWLIPTIAKSLFSDPSTLVGIPAGETLARGASSANGNLHKSGGGSLSSKQAALTYNKATEEVIAMEAEIDRAHRSPFDITSKNTFLGSIFASFYSLAATSGAKSTSVINSFSNLANRSLASVVPSTYADGEGLNYRTTFGDCKNLESIGAVGDVYCNPIMSTDLSTIDISPDDTSYQNALNSQVENIGEENEQVIKDSDLYKYINYCSERNSPFGVVDANILADTNPLDIDGTTVSSITGSTPLLGDFLDIVEAAETAKNMDWADGTNCVNNDSKFWKEQGAYYQRYIEDNRIFEQMGAIETNPVTVAKAEYLEDHPLDNSKSGYLSRIAGITKEDAELVLAVADYYTFLADYDPSSLYAFGSEKPEKIFYNFDSEGKTYISLLTPVIYSDIRNRTYAI